MAGQEPARGLLPAIRQAGAAADAEWTQHSAKLAAELLAIPNPAERAAAYASLSARLAVTGDSLRPEDDARVRASFGPQPVPAAEPEPHPADYARALEEWRARDAATQAAKRSLENWRAWATWSFVPFAAIVPAAAAAGRNGWGFKDVLAVLPSLSWLSLEPLGLILGGIAGAVACGWLASRARTMDRLLLATGGAAVAGVAIMLGARSLPIYRIPADVKTSDGRSMLGAVVEFNHVPGGARIEVLRGNGALVRGERLDLRGAQPFRDLIGGT